MASPARVIGLAAEVQARLSSIKDIKKDAQDLSFSLARLSGLLQCCLAKIDNTKWASSSVQAPLSAMEAILKDGLEDLAGRLERLPATVKFLSADNLLNDLSALLGSLSRQMGELQLVLKVDNEPSLKEDFQRVRADLQSIPERLTVLNSFSTDVAALQQEVVALDRASAASSSGGGAPAAPSAGLAEALRMQALVQARIREALEKQGAGAAMPTAWGRTVEQLRVEVATVRATGDADVAFLQRMTAVLGAGMGAGGRDSTDGVMPGSESARRHLWLPVSYCCPITRLLMRDPVVLLEDMNHCFERASLVNWLATHDTHPMTNSVLKSKEIKPAGNVRRAIEEWLEEHGLTYEHADELDPRIESRRVSSASGALAHLPPPVQLASPTPTGLSAGAASPPVHTPAHAHAPVPAALAPIVVPAPVVNSQDVSTLFEACKAGNLSEVKRLLSLSGASPNAAQHGLTPLYIAASSGHVDVARALLAVGASPDGCVGPYGQTPLYLAAEAGLAELVGALLTAGADKEAATHNGWRPLHAAAWANRLQVVRALLAAGANTDAAKKDGRTPLNVAAVKGHVDVVRALVGAGANTEAPDKYGYMPLHLASGRRGKADMVRTLLAVGANKDAVNKEGETALYIAALQGVAEVVGLLIGAGANVNAATKDGWTPLHVALNVEIVRSLLSAGARMEAATNRLETPLYVAAMQGRTDVVKELVAKGARVDAANQDGETPLQVAVRTGREPVREALQGVTERMVREQQAASLREDVQKQMAQELTVKDKDEHKKKKGLKGLLHNLL